MTDYLVVGAVPLTQRRLVTGTYLTPESFNGLLSGSAPACMAHWREDSYTCKHAAAWAVVDDALQVMHLLDDATAEERAILDDIHAGRLFWSYGQTPTPAATRAAIAAQQSTPDVYWPSALKGQRIAHWSYVTLAAWTQAPIYVLGTNAGAGWQLAPGVSDNVRYSVR